MRRIFFPLLLMLMILLSATVANAGDIPRQEITFQQAVDMAKGNSKALQTARYDIDRAYEVQKSISNRIVYIPLTTSPSPDPAARAATAWQQADISWQMAKRDYETREDAIVMQTYQSYNGLLQAMEKVRVAEAQLKSQEWKRRAAILSHQLGMADRMSLIQAESAMTSARAGLEAANKSLDDAFQKFNFVVGLSTQSRPLLVDKPNHKPLEVSNIHYEVERITEQNPSVWLSEQRIDLAKLTLNIHSFNDPNSTDSYFAKQIDVNKAEVASADVKEQARRLVRTLYYTAKQLEEQYTGAQGIVRQAEENLRVVKIKYDVGMVTMNDVLAAETVLAQAQQSLLDITCQHQILSYAFYKPWAYAAVN